MDQEMAVQLRNIFLAGMPETFVGIIIFLLILLFLGLLTSILSKLMGVGGGFIMTPVFFYIFGMPVYQAVGSSVLVILTNSVFALKEMDSPKMLIKKYRPLYGFVFLGGAAGTALSLSVLRNTDNNSSLVQIIYAVLLIVFALITFAEILVEQSRHSGKQLKKQIHFEIGKICAVGFLGSMLPSLIGVSGGIFFLPMFLLLTNLHHREIAALNLTIVFLSSLIAFLGMIISVSQGYYSINILIPLVIFPVSRFGVIIGSKMLKKIDRAPFSMVLAFLLLASALAVIIKEII